MAADLTAVWNESGTPVQVGASAAGTFTAPAAGELRLVLDNAYSKLRTNAILAIRTPRTCFWGPRNIRRTNLLYTKLSLGAQ
jgi:hypothetical protein